MDNMLDKLKTMTDADLLELHSAVCAERHNRALAACPVYYTESPNREPYFKRNKKSLADMGRDENGKPK